MNYPAAELRGIRCHAGLDKPAPAISKPGASSLDFWIPTFILLRRISRNDDSRQARDMKRKMLTLSPSPADCKELSIYSQHPSPQGEGASGNPTASGWGIKKIKCK